MGQLEQQQQQQQQQGDPVSIDLGLDDDAEEDDDVEYVTNEQAYLSQLVREGIAYANGQPFARHDASRAGYTLPLPQQLHPQPPELGYDLFGDRTWQHIQQEKELKGASLKHEYRAVRCALPYLQDGLMLLEDARSVIEDDDISEIIGAALNTIRGGFALLGKRCDMLKLQVEAKVNPTVITKDALVRLRTHQTPMAEGLDLQDSSILEVLEDLQKTTDTKLARLTAEKIAGAISNGGAQGAGAGKNPKVQNAPTAALRGRGDKPAVPVKKVPPPAPAPPTAEKQVRFTDKPAAPTDGGGRRGGRGGGRDGGRGAGRGRGRGADGASPNTSAKDKGKQPAAPSPPGPSILQAELDPYEE